MIGIQTKVAGVPQLLAKLRAIDEKVAKKALKEAVGETTKPILKDMKANAPTDTKLLKKALGRKVKTYRNALVAVGVVGVRKGFKGKKGQRKRTDKWKSVRVNRRGKTEIQDPVKEAPFAEFGTKPHSLAKGDRLARAGRKHKEVQTGRRHPGAKPHPFMRPALDKNRHGSKEIMARVLKARLEQAAKK